MARLETVQGPGRRCDCKVVREEVTPSFESHADEYRSLRVYRGLIESVGGGGKR